MLTIDYVISLKEHENMIAGSVTRVKKGCACNDQKGLQLAHIIFQDLQFVYIETEKLRTENAEPMHAYQKQENTVDNKVYTTDSSST